MSKQVWKPGNMLYPLPAVMVSCGDKEGNANIVTIAWTGTVCTNPAMLYISLRPERHSYQMIKETGEFVVNLTTKDLVYATDYCGVRSGRDVDKFKEMKLTKQKAEKLMYAPIIKESPVSIECKVVEIKELGTHHMFLAQVLAVDIDERYMDKSGKFRLNSADLMVYSHGEYFNLKEQLGTFGYSVRKKTTTKTKNKSSQNKVNLPKKELKWIRTDTKKDSVKK
ncbi:flavin reductase family protein [Candidatus Galacturonibacter soehngenii]|uniref:Flavin reductase family protein n=1 Tax=Candidatus Galacturonatibacter soehngenii TaxID=2307010 RepID=A0A7V7QLC7_9FIRM|nr:flavin reductase family protein [Candidatus Galacturonibacter soehngenii]KAB1438606.1 flavin reductase family protein [Candidatus Galacturonibacter soehngenii]MBA4685634.1 flavin reductase family protein [Candidatus Galacturonibacter soehngenii]